MAYISSSIHCHSCGADLEIIYRAPTPGSLADYFTSLTAGIVGAPIAPGTTICPHCGGDIGDHSGDGDDPDERGAA